jgi:purine-binding chemotaxis protein CheW
VNREPALQTMTKGPLGQEDWRANPNESLASGRVEFISFSIGDEQYGVDIMAVREIKGWTEITHLPKQPEYVRGVLNLRGVMVPIIDLRCRFGQGKTEATALHVVIVVQVEARLIGLLADRVLDILSFAATQVQPVPQIARSSRIDFLSGLVTIDGTMIALVDLPNLLAERPGEDDAAAAAASMPAEPAKALT